MGPIQLEKDPHCVHLHKCAIEEVLLTEREMVMLMLNFWDFWEGKVKVKRNKNYFHFKTQHLDAIWEKHMAWNAAHFQGQDYFKKQKKNKIIEPVLTKLELNCFLLLKLKSQNLLKKEVRMADRGNHDPFLWVHFSWNT